MTKRTKMIEPDDDRPWSGIRPPWSRIANPHGYLRAELALVICREFANSDAVVCRCPVLDGSEPHAVTLRGLWARDDVGVSISCPKHKSAEIIDAILDQLEEQE